MKKIINADELSNWLESEFYNVVNRTSLTPTEIRVDLELMTEIIKCKNKVKELTQVSNESDYKPCDPILMTYTIEDFLKVVEDAKCFGLEVVIHNGKPYYRDIT